MDDLEKSTWMIENVPKEARRLIKAYAAKHDLPIGMALLKLIKDKE